MTQRTKKLMLIYLSGLIAYAALGAYNQGLFRQQLQLIESKQTLLDDIVGLRTQAADIVGALAVRDWAQAQGMIPAPEGGQAIPIFPAPPPTFVLPQSGLEIRTIWR